MIIGILSGIIILAVVLLAFFIYKLNDWNGWVDKVPYAVWISFIIFTSIVIVIAMSLLVWQIGKIM